MGDASDPKLAKVIKKTQELLGKHVKKPPLSEKNLARPPFRFLHDIVTNVISSTGYLSGVFTPEEMDVANVSTREAKAAFMQKLIQAIKETTGETLTVKVSKILAGQEADKTNELLQSLARAIVKSEGSGETVKAEQKASKGVPPKDAKKIAAKQPTKPDSTKTTTGGKNTSQAANKSKGPDKPKPKGQDTSKSNIGKDEKSSNPVNKIEEPIPSTSKISQPSGLAAEEVDDAQKLQSDSTFGEPSADDKGRKSTAGSRGSSGALRRQNSSISRPTPEESTLTNINEDNNEKDTGNSTKLEAQDAEVVEVVVDDDDKHESLYHDFKSSAIKPSMDTLSVPLSPLIPDAKPDGASHSESLDQKESAGIGDNINESFTFTPSLVASSAEKGDPTGQSVVGSENQDSSDFGVQHNVSATRASSTAKFRPGTGTTRLGSARPPSARPAPPRPRSSMIQEAVQESNFRPPTGKVSNVILETQDQDEDDTFVVREAVVSKGPGLSDLDEGPELAMTTVSVKPEDQMEDFLVPPEQRGLLVNQILETQKELEDSSNAKKEKLEAERSTVNEITAADIEKLKTLIQASARNANPLGKLLDYVREDVDSIQNEISKWRDESRQLDADLEAARKANESALQPLQDQLKDVESQIRDKEDAIAMTKMSILRNQERIDKILAGLDQVLTSRTRLPIPTKDEFLSYVAENQRASQKPIFSAFSAVKPIDSFNHGELLRDDNEDNPHSRESSGLGNSLGRYTRGNSIHSMQPNFDGLDDDDDDLESEKFDAWKVLNGN